MKSHKILRSNRDLPQLEGINLNAQAAAGSGADYEHAVVSLPNLAQGATAGTAGEMAINTMTIRWILLTWEAAITGAATNNFTINIRQRRSGNLLVNTTSATTIAVGLQTVTPASMTNIINGMQLVFSGGTGSTETVVVQNVNVGAGTFQAVFVGAHSGAYTIVHAPLATITYGNGTNATAYAPVQLAAWPINYIQAGDTVTVQRVSNGTGLASPACTVTLDWVEANAA